MSKWLLNISKEGNSTNSLGNLCHCLVTCRGKYVFFGVKMITPAFQSVPIVSWLATRLPLVESHEIPVSPFLQSVFPRIGLYFLSAIWFFFPLPTLFEWCSPIMCNHKVIWGKNVLNTSVILQKIILEIKTRSQGQGCYWFCNLSVRMLLWVTVQKISGAQGLSAATASSVALLDIPSDVCLVS